MADDIGIDDNRSQSPKQITQVKPPPAKGKGFVPPPPPIVPTYAQIAPQAYSQGFPQQQVSQIYPTKGPGDAGMPTQYQPQSDFTVAPNPTGFSDPQRMFDPASDTGKLMMAEDQKRIGQIRLAKRMRDEQLEKDPQAAGKAAIFENLNQHGHSGFHTSHQFTKLLRDASVQAYLGKQVQDKQDAAELKEMGETARRFGYAGASPEDVHQFAQLHQDWAKANMEHADKVDQRKLEAQNHYWGNVAQMMNAYSGKQGADASTVQAGISGQHLDLERQKFKDAQGAAARAEKRQSVLDEDKRYLDAHTMAYQNKTLDFEGMKYYEEKQQAYQKNLADQEKDNRDMRLKLAEVIKDPENNELVPKYQGTTTQPAVEPNMFGQGGEPEKQVPSGQSVGYTPLPPPIKPTMPQMGAPTQQDVANAMRPSQGAMPTGAPSAGAGVGQQQAAAPGGTQQSAPQQNAPQGNAPKLKIRAASPDALASYRANKNKVPGLRQQFIAWYGWDPGE
jgi:hypothetical protein